LFSLLGKQPTRWVGEAWFIVFGFRPEGRLHLSASLGETRTGLGRVVVGNHSQHNLRRLQYNASALEWGGRGAQFLEVGASFYPDRCPDHFTIVTVAATMRAVVMVATMLAALAVAVVAAMAAGVAA